MGDEGEAVIAVPHPAADFNPPIIASRLYQFVAISSGGHCPLPEHAQYARDGSG